jgi:hypothetical protein
MHAPPSPQVSPRASQRSAMEQLGIEAGQSVARAPHSAARNTRTRVVCPGVNAKRIRRVNRSDSLLLAHGSALTSNHTTAVF